MIDPSMVPTIDPNPLPAPYWLFKTLLLVTFTLHIIAMNFMLGGAFLAVVARFTSKGREYRNRIFLDLAKKIPVFLAATITIGIAPLLFVQATTASTSTPRPSSSPGPGSSSSSCSSSPTTAFTSSPTTDSAAPVPQASSSSSASCWS